MGYGKRAVRYLKRKKKKTVILFLILLITETMMLCMETIGRASEGSIDTLKEKTKSKIVAEITKEGNLITATEVHQIKKISQVREINRKCQITGIPSDFQVVSGSMSTDSDNLQVRIITYDDLESDGAFADGQIRLTAGNFPKTDNQVVINQFLADQNQLEVGDTFTMQSEEGEMIQGTISGCYLSGTERNQAEEMSAVYRIENTVYGKTELLFQVSTQPGYESVAAYVKNPDAIEEVSQDITNILGDKAELTKADTLFQQMKQPMEQILGIVRIILYLTMGTAAVIITLVLSMWMRSRKKEVAIYISLGERKMSIFMQMILESFLVFLLSSITAVVTGTFLVRWLESFLFSGESSFQTVEISLQFADLGFLAVAGIGLLFFAVAISLFPVLRGNPPKDTLAEMEG